MDAPGKAAPRVYLFIEVRVLVRRYPPPCMQHQPQTAAEGVWVCAWIHLAQFPVVTGTNPTCLTSVRGVVRWFVTLAEGGGGLHLFRKHHVFSMQVRGAFEEKGAGWPREDSAFP